MHDYMLLRMVIVMIRVALVDDEEPVLEFLKTKVSEMSMEFSVDHKIETFVNGTDLLRRNSESPFHVIILDLEMPEMDGLCVAKRLRENYPNTVLFFITNRSDLVFRSFEFDVAGFVRKTHIEDELKSTLDRAYQKVLTRMSNYALKTDCGERMFTSDSICYFISNDHKVFLYDEAKKSTRIMMTLEKLEGFLSPRCFVRCHSGIIVNCKFIHSIGNTSITLTNNETLPLSRHRTKNVKQVFQRYLRSM